MNTYQKLKANYYALELGEELMAIIEKATERAGRLGLHTVHYFYKDVIDGNLEHRSGYFEEGAEAELFAKSLYDHIISTKVTALILLDNALYVEKLIGDDAKIFMSKGQMPKVLRSRTYYYYPFNIFEAEVNLPGIGNVYACLSVTDGEIINENEVECHFYKKPYADIDDVDKFELAIECTEIEDQLLHIWNSNPHFIDDANVWRVF